jgi:hypothetical protein
VTRSFSVVAGADLQSARPESVAQRVRRLQAEARELSKDHIHQLTTAMVQAIDLAGEIADGGDVYPAGVRDLARRANAVARVGHWRPASET